jgi:hypothetical protein
MIYRPSNLALTANATPFFADLLSPGPQGIGKEHSSPWSMLEQPTAP